MEKENKIDEDQNKCKSKVLEFKVYSRPELTELGSMQKITLNSSQLGTGDSGGAGGPYTFV